MTNADLAPGGHQLTRHMVCHFCRNMLQFAASCHTIPQCAAYVNKCLHQYKTMQDTEQKCVTLQRNASGRVCLSAAAIHIYHCHLSLLLSLTLELVHSEQIMVFMQTFIRVRIMLHWLHRISILLWKPFGTCTCSLCFWQLCFSL